MGVNRAIDIVIEAQNHASSEINALRGDLDRLNQMGSNMQDMSKGFLAYGAAIAGGAGVATAVTADFEQQLADTAARMGRTAGDWKDLEKVAREYGQTTKFTATEAATSMKLLAQKGISDVSEMAKHMSGIINLASAQNADLSRTTDLVIGSMKVFKDQGYTSVDVADLFAQATRTSSADLDKFRYSMKYVQGAGKSMGMTLEEVTASLDMLYDANVPAETAGTALRMAWKRLLDPTKAASNAIQDMGLSLEEVNPQTNSFADILDTLGEAGITTKQAFKVFGAEGASAILTMVDQGGAALREHTKQLENAGGTAQRMADVQLATLNGQLALLKSAFTETAISVGMMLIPKITALVQKVKEVVDWVNSWSEQTKKIVTISLLVSGAVATMIGSFLLIVGTLLKVIATWREFFGVLRLMSTYGKFDKLVRGVRLVGMAFTYMRIQVLALSSAFLANPIVLAILAIIAVAVLLYKAWTNNWGGIQEKTKAVLDWMKNAMSVATDWIIMAWNKTIAWFQSFGSKLQTYLVNAWVNAKNWVIQTVMELRNKLYNFLLGILMDTGQTQEQAKQTIKDAWNNIKAFFSVTFDLIKYLLFGMWAEMFTDTVEHVTKIWGTVSKGFNKLKADATTIFNALKVAIGIIWNYIYSGTIKPVLTAIWNMVSTTLNDVADNFRFAFDVVKAIVSIVMPFIKSMIGGSLKAIWASVKFYLNFIKDFFKMIWENIKAIVRGALTVLKNIIALALNLLAGNWDEAWQNVVNIMEAVWDTILNVLENGLDLIISTIQNWFGTVKDSGAALMSAFADGISGAVGKVTGAVSDLMGSAREYFGFSDAKRGPFSNITYSGYATMSAFAKGATQAKGLLSRKIGGTLSGAMAGGMAGNFALNGMGAARVGGLRNNPAPSQNSGNKIEKVEININGADGADKESIAKEVMRELERQLGEG